MLVGRQGQRDGAAQGHGGEEDAAPPGQARDFVRGQQHLLRALHRRRGGQRLVPAARAARVHCRHRGHRPHGQGRALGTAGRGRSKARAPRPGLRERQRPQPPTAEPAQHACARAEPERRASQTSGRSRPVDPARMRRRPRSVRWARARPQPS